MSSLVTKRRSYPSFAEIKDWSCPDTVVMSESDRANFDRKKSAIDQFHQGTSLVDIEKSTGISRQHLNFLLKRFHAINIHGRPIGYFSLIKHMHIGADRRNDLEKLDCGRPLAGSFQALFTKYPDLREAMYKMIVEGKAPDSDRANARLTWYQIHEAFIQLCNNFGIRPPSYPFCSDSLGIVALKNWGNRMIAQHESENLSPFASWNQNVIDAKEPPSRVFERVEMDGHFLDVNWTLEVPSLNGEGVIHLQISRLWLIALLECKSTAVIGYSVSFGRNYNATDVNHAVQNSLVPWQPRKLTLSTISYKPGECLPNALIPELSYVCYDELWLDNAKSHLSDIFLTMLERTVNAVPVFGPKKSPNVRPRIEMLFDLLEEAGIHCLAGTTGAHPKDPRRSGEDEERFILTLDILLDLIDLLIVRYNTGIAPGTTISRNEVLKRAVMRETGFFRRVPKNKRVNCFKYCIFEEAVIGKERGRPILRWRNARYDGPGLHASPNLIGQKVLVMASKDVRRIEVLLLADGSSLGELIVEKRWRSTPHTLATRTAIRRVMTNNSFISHAADIPLAVRAHVEKEVKEKRRLQRFLAQLMLEQQHENPYVGAEFQTVDSNDLGPRDTSKEMQEHAGRQHVPDLAKSTEEPDVLDTLIDKLGTTYR